MQKLNHNFLFAECLQLIKAGKLDQLGKIILRHVVKYNSMIDKIKQLEKDNDFLAAELSQTTQTDTPF